MLLSNIELIATKAEQLPNPGLSPSGLNFLLFHQQVAPLTLIAQFRPPHAPIGEIEEYV